MSIIKTLDEIAKDLDMTKERVRQIKVKLEAELNSYFHFIINLNAENKTNYDLDKDIAYRVIDTSFVSKTNCIEKVDFNMTFYSVIF